MARIIGWIFKGARLITPWVVQFIGFMLTSIIRMIAALWVGIPRGVNNLAFNWTGRALASGIPLIYDKWIYRIMQVVAFLVIAVGWIIASYLTVWLVGWIF